MSKPISTALPLMFFNRHQAAVVDAMAARIVPSEEGSPGAREAQAIIYIDRALAGYFASLQVLYREGIDRVEAMSVASFGKPFVALESSEQDSLLQAMIDGPPKTAEFFAVVYEHVIEGTFGDPLYGGNANAVGWKLIGFPGAQWGYSPAQMAKGFDARSIPIVTLADTGRLK